MSWILLITIYFLNLICAFIIFASNRESYSKLSWFILIVIFPIVGCFFFLIFGGRFKGRMSNEKYHELYSKTYSNQKNCNLNSIPTQTRESLINISNVVNHPISSCDIKTIECGGKAFEQMFDDMRKAKKFIHAQYYIFKQGEIFEEFKSILIAKKSEGVEVRLIIDDFGRWALPWYEINNLKKQGIEIAIWAKVHFPFISGENGYRTHRKYLIIDGECVYTGGLNVSDEYAHLSKKYGYWFDVQNKITGHAVRTYSLLFINDWWYMGDKTISIKKYAPLPKKIGKSYSIMIESGPDNVASQILDTIIKLIMSARKSIYLTTPYLVPNDNLIMALRVAAASGVDIKIIIPGLNDKKNVALVTHYYAKLLQSFGIKFYTINNGFMHAKIGIFDDKIAYTGTFNLDIRSFFQQFEVTNIIHGDAIKDIRNIFESYLKYSTLKKFKIVKKQKLHNRAYTVLVRIFAPLM